MSETAVIVLNVPSQLNTGDLRRFFTGKKKVIYCLCFRNWSLMYLFTYLLSFLSPDFVETGKFSTFHYKRRPLAHLIKQAKDSGSCPPAVRCIYDAIVEQCPQHGEDEFLGTNIALAKLPTSHLKTFLDKYHSRQWMGQVRIYQDYVLWCFFAGLFFLNLTSNS